MNCIFRSNKHENGCSILHCKCEPNCKWMHTEESYLASLHKAHMNHKATHHKDTYIGNVPTAWVDKYIAYEMAHQDAENTR